MNHIFFYRILLIFQVFVIRNLFGRVQVEPLHSEFILQVIESERVKLKSFKVKSFSRWLKQMIQIKTDELTRETPSSLFLYFKNILFLGCVNLLNVGARRFYQKNNCLELCGLLLPYVFTFVLLSSSVWSCILVTLLYIFLLCVSLLVTSLELKWRFCRVTAFLLMPLSTLYLFGWLGFATFVSNWFMTTKIQSFFRTPPESDDQQTED